jgi:NAD dependent epimerase/dehydratase family enzyme
MFADYTTNRHRLYVLPSFQSDTSNATHVGMMLMRICALYERRAGILALSAIIVIYAIAIVAVGRQMFSWITSENNQHAFKRSR